MGFLPFAPPIPAASSGLILLTGADPTGVADSTAAFQAAITASTGTAAVPVNSELLIPPGTYTCNGALNLTGPLKITGLGGGPVYFGGVLQSGVTITSSNATGLFRFPFQGYLWGGLEISNIAITMTGGGNAFHLMNFTDSAFRNVGINLNHASSMAFYTTGSVSALDVLFERVIIKSTSAVRNNPMVSISATGGANISNTTFFKCKFFNAGLDNTQPMILIQCTGAGSAYHFADNLIECWFEHPFGGAYRSLSGQNITVQGCSIWDIQSGQGVTVGASCFYFGAAAGNSGSQGVRVIGCSRNLNGPDGAATWDVFCESTTSNVQVEQYMTSPLSPSTTYNVFFNFNGCTDVALINNQSPQGATVNGNSTTVVTNPSPTQLAIVQGLVTPDPVGMWTARDTGVLAWTYDPAETAGTTSPASGTIQLARINVRAAISVTNVTVICAAGGTTLTAGQNFVGLFNSAGNQVGISADQSAAWASGGTKTAALVGGPFTLAPGIYYVAILSVGVVAPTFFRLQNVSAVIANARLGTGGTWRSSTNGAGATALPGSFVYSAGATAQNLYYADLT